MSQSPPFRSYSSYLKEKYGEPVYRVGVDAGFSCPNRGRDRSRPGCLYCDEHGARAPYLPDSADLRRQVEGAVQFLHARYGAKLYILYFQAFSGTYAPIERLRNIYDYALSLAPFREIIVSTRPDCIAEETAALLASYKRWGLDVWVELGLQSASDQTLKRINRGHTVESFKRAYLVLRNQGLKITVHLIFGLPGEGEREILDTVRFVSALRPEGVKIHNLHIPFGSPLFQEYLKGELTAPSHLRHLQYVIKALEMLPPQTVIMRLTCDTPASRLAGPRGFWPKAKFYEHLRSEMLKVETRQGKKFKADPR